MEDLEKSIVSTLLYYRLLDRPLTNVELFRFLNAGDLRQYSFCDIVKKLRDSKVLKSLILQSWGFYFPKKIESQKNTDPSRLIELRQKRIKISQLKWKKIKGAAKILQIVPFLRMIGVTGSLSLDNAKQQSDFDFLIILKSGRLWLGRTIITLLLGVLGLRRHQQKTKDRVCLNCYLINSSLEIKQGIKPHDFHSSQEYARLILLWQNKEFFAQFQTANCWIKDFLVNYPWPSRFNQKNVKSNRFLTLARGGLEAVLSGFWGDWLEIKLGRWQIKRIEHKIKKEDPSDQIYFSDKYLMFHPRSKSVNLLKMHQAKLEEFINLGSKIEEEKLKTQALPQ